MAGLHTWLHSLINKGKTRRPGRWSRRYGKALKHISPAVKAHNEAALALYKQLFPNHENLFFSPFSIITTLRIARAGARGQTAGQIDKILGFAAKDLPSANFADLTGALQTTGAKEYQLTVANSLWSQCGATIQPEFLKTIAGSKNNLLKSVDFRNEEIARTTINRWIADETNKKIRELIPPGGLSQLTGLVIVSAIYFKGMWTHPFHRSDTKEQPFFLEDDGRVCVPLMHQQVQIRYLERGHFQAVDLGYLGNDLSMLVLLPKKKDGLRELELQLPAGVVHDCLLQMRVCEVSLFLPAFRMSWGTVDLATELEALGISRAFNRHEADFSGINGRKPPDEDALFISSLYHKAFVEVNEEGTEAAAASGAAMFFYLGESEESIPVFRADHPFLFAIYDTNSGRILFVGRMANPGLWKTGAGLFKP